jgi:hypothetical protein
LSSSRLKIRGSSYIRVSTVEGEQAMPCPDIHWVHAARPSGEKLGRRPSYRHSSPERV